MTQNAYWYISIVIASIALVLSIASFVLGYKNRVDQRQALLMSKKTDLLTRLSEARGKFGHLTMIYAQKVLFIRGANSNALANEEARAHNNLELVHRQVAHCDEICARVRSTRADDLEALESQLGTANEMLAHATAELSKEKEAFADLKEYLSH